MKKQTKTKAKASDRKRKGIKPVEEVTPTYLPPGASFVMGLHDLIKVVEMIEKHDHLTKFKRKLNSEQAQVRIPAHTVNVVKDFVAGNRLHKNSIGKHIVNARQKEPLENMQTRTVVATEATTADEGDPNQCHFGRMERG